MRMREDALCTTAICAPMQVAQAHACKLCDCKFVTGLPSNPAVHWGNFLTDTIHGRDRWVPHDLVVRARTLTTKHLDGVERDLVLQVRA
jgi:hypothetical protein